MASKLSALLTLVVLLGCVLRTQALTQISNCTELQTMKNNLTESYELVNDIDCSDTVNWNGGQGFEPVGNLSQPFSGLINGGFYRLSNLYIDRQTENYVGLIGYSSGASIEALILDDVDVSGNDNTGGLIGTAAALSTFVKSTVSGTVSGAARTGIFAGRLESNSRISWSSSSGTVSANGGGGGGFIGSVSIDATIKYSHSNAMVIVSTNAAGGFIGSTQGYVIGCFAAGSVSSATEGGGFAGDFSGTILDSYTTASVSTNFQNAGGFVGNAQGEIRRCYSTGTVSGGSNVGGFAGRTTGAFSGGSNYWDIQTSGQSSSAAGEGKTTSEMYQAATYIGWNFTRTWWIDEGSDYPVLRWFLVPTVKNPLSDQVIPVDESYTLAISTAFEDLSNTGLNYTVVLSPNKALPAWLAFNEQSQTFVGTPQSSDAGNYTIIVTACSANLLCATDEFTLFVRVPVSISNCTELQAMQNDLHGIYYLTNDIDCSDTRNWNSGEGFEPVGEYITDQFGGVLDGNNYAISNLHINRSTKNYVALFGLTRGISVLMNVALQSVNITGNQWVGGLVGLKCGEAYDCYVTGLVLGINTVGGLVGENSGTFSILINSHAFVEVIGNERVGGLVGQNKESASISTCYASGTVTNAINVVGGLVGWNHASAIIKNSYATTHVTALAERAGGLVGINSGLIEHSSSFGSLTNCTSHVGGLVGVNEDGIVTNSYAQVTVSASGNNIGGLVGWNDYTISNSYSAGFTLGNANVGGMVGLSLASGTITKSYSESSVSALGSKGGGGVGRNLGIVQECYAKGIVSANSMLGGFIAENIGTATQSYWDTQTSGLATSDGGTGKTTAQMYQQATFVSWDFAGTWSIDEGNNYPTLKTLSPTLLQNPIQDQNTIVNVLFSFTVPSNTFLNVTSPTMTFDAKQLSDPTLPIWLTFTPTNQTFSGWPMPSDRGQYTIVVTVCDDLNQCNSNSFVLNVNNQAPTLVQLLANQRFTVETPFAWQIPAGTFNDADGDILIYTAELQGGGSLPGWLSVNGTTGTFSGTIPSSQSATLMITVIVDDGAGGQISDAFELSVNFPPTLEDFVDNQVASVGNPFLFTFTPTLFSEPDGEPLSYNATQTNNMPLPVWLDFNGPTRTFLGTPMLGDQGLLFVLLIASDPYDGSVSASFGIAISSSGGNNPPVLVVAIPAQSGNLEALWTFIVPPTTFQDPESDTLIYAATLEGGPPLPAWLIFEPSTQTFSGATAAPGAWRITVRVEDGNGGFALSTFTLTMEDTRNQLPALLNPLPNQEVKVDSNFGYTIPDNTFSDPNGDELRYTATQSGNRSLPDWLKFDGSTRTLSGRPSNTDTNTFADRKHTIHVCAHDDEASACSDFLLTVSGASQTQQILTVFFIIGSLISTMVAGYGYRGLLWNTFMKKKYMKPKQTITLGEEFHQTIEYPSDSVSELQIYHKKKLFKRGVPWLTYKFGSTHSLSGRPTETSDAGSYVFSLIGHHGQIVVAYPLCVKKAGEADDDDEGKSWWAKLTGACSTCKKDTDVEMNDF